MSYFVINEKDNVRVNLEDGHKYALKNIGAGEKVIKYGYPIGVAKCDIAENEKVHSHNLKTDLSTYQEYTYLPEKTERERRESPTVRAYIRKDGRIGIRNHIWIIPTVGCVNKTAEILAKRTDSLAFTHPYGCSQLGGDHEITQKILKGLILHPNAGGVLVLGLGCENNNINEMKKILGETDSERIRFLNCQECEDEIQQGEKIIAELKAIADQDERKEVPLSEIVIGFKCGGSDGLSGITANPLTGRLCDRITDMGASAVLTEVPEMFGAEQILMNRCESEEVFRKTVKLINGFKKYFTDHGQPVSENPSPGNKEGGITTLEEKSLGCVQKGGSATVTDVLSYGDIVNKKGLNLLNGPGNDIVAVTNLTAAGCHLILFTTGRGTPLGAPVPTIKISTNTALYEKKRHWIDFDAGRCLTENTDEEFFRYIVSVIEGEETNNERNGYREIAIFKDGVTL